MIFFFCVYIFVQQFHFIVNILFYQDKNKIFILKWRGGSLKINEKGS